MQTKPRIDSFSKVDEKRAYFSTIDIRFSENFPEDKKAEILARLEQSIVWHSFPFLNGIKSLKFDYPIIDYKLVNDEPVPNHDFRIDIEYHEAKTTSRDASSFISLMNCKLTFKLKGNLRPTNIIDGKFS